MDIDKKIIEQVKSYECLYDLSSPLYKDVIMKDTIWEEIGGRLGISGPECRKRWKVLRDTYRRAKQHRSKLLASGGATSLRRKRWRHSNAMAFLDEVQSSRRARTFTTVPEINRPECDSPPTCDDDHIFQPSRVLETPTSVSAVSSPPASTAPELSLHDTFDVFLRDLSKSANRVADTFGQRCSETHSERLFASFGRMLDLSDLPKSAVQSIQNEVRTAIFTAIQNFSVRKN